MVDMTRVVKVADFGAVHEGPGEGATSVGAAGATGVARAAAELKMGGGTDTHAMTRRIVGTYAYMPTGSHKISGFPCILFKPLRVFLVHFLAQSITCLGT